MTGKILLAAALAVFVLTQLPLEPYETVYSSLAPWPDAAEYVDGAVHLAEHGRFAIHIAGREMPSRYPPGYLSERPSVDRVELLIDGQATFDSIREGMAQAQHYILFQEVGTHTVGEGFGSEAVLRQIARGAAVGDDNRFRG